MNHANRIECLFLLVLLWFFSLSGLSQDHLEVRFEQLCRKFVEGTQSTARERLLRFSETSADKRLATLGYYLIGYQDLLQGRLESALEALDRALLGASHVSIADCIAETYAEALQKLNRPAKALDAWKNFLSWFPDSPLAKKALGQLWRNSLALNKPTVIFKSQKTFPKFENSPESLYYLAAAHEAVNEPQEAFEHYLRIYYKFPLSPESSQAFRGLTRLQTTSPKRIPETPLAWKEFRAEKLFLGKHYGEAIKALNILLETRSLVANRPELLLWLGISQFHSRRSAESLKTLKSLPTGFQQEPEIWFYRAENYRRLGDYDSFKKTVEFLQKHFPTSSWLRKAWFSIGNFNLVERQLEEANYFYQQLLNNFSSGSEVMNAHWRVSWYHYRRRDHQRAYSLFLEHLERFHNSPHSPSALYWSARCKEYFGDPQQAVALDQAITQVFSNHYYAQLSHGHLSRLAGNESTKAPLDVRLFRIMTRLKRQANERLSLDISNLADDSGPIPPKVKAFSLIQLFDSAAREILRTSERSPPTLFQAATFFHQGSHFSSSTYNLQRIFPGYVYRPLSSLPIEIWRMLFPIQYGPLFLSEARKHQVDPYLLVSLARQESIFDPKALSSANARGVMQLLPSTASKVASQLDLQQLSEGQLYDPHLNIRLGTKYLAERLRQFNGEVNQALASYNAGPHRVKLWLREGNYLEKGEFVENIPFTETRNYVKIINRNYWLYKRVYGESLWE